MDPKTDQKVAGLSPGKDPVSLDAVPLESGQEQMQKGRWERSWPTIACGAGLFSDGYLNGVWFLSYL